VTDLQRVAVIGGSLGGLSAALTLRRLGLEVDVFEKSIRHNRHRGAGIVVQPDVVHLLREVAPGERLAKVQARVRRSYNRRGELEREVVMPQTFTSWDAVYSPLRRAFGEERYHQGKRLVGLAQAEGGATASFEDGSRVAADLIVAADGAESAARALLHPGTEQTYAGYVAWRGTLEERDAPREVTAFLEGTFTFMELEEGHLLAYLIPGENASTAMGERRLNWVWYVNVPGGPALDALMTDVQGERRVWSMPPGLTRPEVTTRMHEDARRLLPGPLASLVTLARAPFLQPIRDVVVPRVRFGRAVLLGDAGFVVRPHTAASTAKAAAGALSLAQHLSRADRNVDLALRAWEAGELVTGRRLLHLGHALGEHSRLGD